MTKLDIIDTILAAMPGTRREIEKSTGLAKTTVFRRAAQLHAAGWCHIGGWRVGGHGGFYQPVYKAGAGKDRPCTLQPPAAHGLQLAMADMQRMGRVAAKYSRQHGLSTGRAADGLFGEVNSYALAALESALPTLQLVAEVAHA